jgi:hypothetical protein
MSILDVQADALGDSRDFVRSFVVISDDPARADVIRSDRNMAGHIVANTDVFGPPPRDSG